MPRILFIGGGSSKYPCQLLKTGQTTQYNSELDDGYYEAGVAKSYTVLTTGQYSGTTNIDLAHLINTGISFDAATKEIRCTGQCGVFKAAGGETIVVSGASQAGNNAVWTTASATADKVVLTTAPTDESAGANITIAKREAMSNNCVQDNNTGLMWARYRFTKFGVLGNGYMPWTGTIYDIFQACAAANAVSLGGHNDWKVPGFLQLVSLLDAEAPLGIPDSDAFPTGMSADFWTSTTDPADSTKSTMVRFYQILHYPYAKTVAYALLLVRGGL